MPVRKGADSEYQVSEGLKTAETISSTYKGKVIIPRLLRRLGQDRNARVMDVGTGLGFILQGLKEAGFENVVGLEPGGRFNDSEFAFVYQEFISDYISARPMSKFDLVMSHGVIEHIGTTDGHANLAADFQRDRREFYRDCLSAVDDDGFLLVFGPNRLFPFDIQHGSAQYGPLGKIKKLAPFLKMLTIPWSKENFLVSWDDVNREVLSVATDGGFSIEAFYLPQSGFVVGANSKSPFLRTAFQLYTKCIDRLPSFIAKFLHTHTLYICKKTRHGK